MQGDVEEKDLKTYRTGQQGVHLECKHISKDVPYGQLWELDSLGDSLIGFTYRKSIMVKALLSFCGK